MLTVQGHVRSGTLLQTTCCIIFCKQFLVEHPVFMQQSCSPEVSQFNHLPNDKFLDRSKLKAFADDKINVT